MSLNKRQNQKPLHFLFLVGKLTKVEMISENLFGRNIQPVCMAIDQPDICWCNYIVRNIQNQGKVVMIILICASINILTAAANGITNPKVKWKFKT